MTAHLNVHENKTVEIFWPNRFEIQWRGEGETRHRIDIHMESDKPIHDNLLHNLQKLDDMIRNNRYRLNAIYIYIHTLDGIKNLRFSECDYITLKMKDKLSPLPPSLGGQIVNLKPTTGWEVDIDFHFLNWTTLKEDQK